MADIKDTVGEGGANHVHDVALVQAMLRVVKDAKNQPYLAGAYDGVYGKQTKAAIDQFQSEQKLLPPTGKDGKTLLGVGGPTVQKLSAMLPATHKELCVIEKMKTVYLAATAADAKAGHTSVITLKDTEPAFRLKAANAVKQVYQDYKLALTVGWKGGRRTFDEQAQILITNPGATTVGPGESNHNWGRAVDLVLSNFRWLQGDGTIVKDTHYADQLEKQKGISTANQIWDARDLPIKAAGLFVLAVTKTFRDRPHVQSFNQNAVNMGNALVNLLNGVGMLRWANKGGSPRRYASDLGLGGGVQHIVGTAVEIWTLKAHVAAADIVAAVNTAKVPLDDARQIWAGKTPTKKAAFAPIAVKDVKAGDVTALQKALKRDFELADQNFLKWKP